MGGMESRPSNQEMNGKELEPPAKIPKKNNIVLDALGKKWKISVDVAKRSELLSQIIANAGENSVVDRVLKLDIPSDKCCLEGLDILIQIATTGESHALCLSNVDEVYAAGKFFGVDDITNLCLPFFEKKFNKDNVLKYYSHALTSHYDDLKLICFDHLLANFFSYSDDEGWLSCISRSLFHKMIAHGMLSVPEAEFSVYQLLKRWIMIDQMRRCQTDITPGIDFRTFIDSVNPLFSHSALYDDMIESIRFGHMLNTTSSLEEIVKDKLFPESALNTMMTDSWKLFLDGHRNAFENDEVEDEYFVENCLRFGHKIESESSWSWFRMIMGVHLEFQYANEKISVTRKLVRNFVNDTVHELDILYNIGVFRKGQTIAKTQPQTKLTLICQKTEDLIEVPPSNETDKKFPLQISFRMLPLTKKLLDSKKYFIQKTSNVVNGISNGSHKH